MRARRTRERPPAPEPQPAPQERIDVSALGSELAEADLRTGDNAELRFGLVSRLRAAVRDGTYPTDAQALARAMVERGEQA